MINEFELLGWKARTNVLGDHISEIIDDFENILILTEKDVPKAVIINYEAYNDLKKLEEKLSNAQN